MSEEPKVIGEEIQFLVDTPSGFGVASVKDIASTVEADLYDDAPDTLDSSQVYALLRDMPPKQVSVTRLLIQASSGERNYDQYVLSIVDRHGGVIAQAPYRFYPN